MAKKIKMVEYGEPGVGKSVFACRAPKPFFITTDGNYEWLEEFGAKEEDHVQVNSWSEAKKVFAELNTDKYSQYQTIVIDLLEDLFKWCEYEFCSKNRIEHVSDIGYGKGYDMTRNEFFIEICKVLGLDKNVILIMHGIDKVVKDRRGVEHTTYVPSPRLPDKLLDMIEGRVRYFLRAYLKAEEGEEHTLIKKRYLSIVPKENEFGIIRGIDENTIPHDIPLDFNEFARVIGFETSTNDETPIKKERKKREVKIETPTVEESNVETIDATEAPSKVVPVKAEVKMEEKVVEEPKVEVKKEIKEEPKKVSDKPTETQEPIAQPTKVESTTTSSNADKLASIKAKYAAILAAKNKK